MASSDNKELLNLLSEFLVTEVGSHALFGVTYTMLLKNNKKDMEKYNKYINIKSEAVKAGFSADQVFRYYEVANGYIFDMDLGVTKKITAEILKSFVDDDSVQVDSVIGDNPEQRRRRDMNLLAKYIKNEYDNGKREVQVALFSRNDTNKITVTCTDNQNNKLVIKYNAYAIRHWDTEQINSDWLMKAGIKITSIQPCEILPSKNGVSFILRLAKVENR